MWSQVSSFFPHFLSVSAHPSLFCAAAQLVFWCGVGPTVPDVQEQSFVVCMSWPKFLMEKTTRKLSGQRIFLALVFVSSGGIFACKIVCRQKNFIIYESILFLTFRIKSFLMTRDLIEFHLNQNRISTRTSFSTWFDQTIGRLGSDKQPAITRADNNIHK